MLVAQPCPALGNLMDCSPPGSSVHGISQVRILEWVAIPSPGDLPDPGIEPWFPALQADSLPSEPPGKPLWIHWLSRYFLSMSNSFSPWDPCSSCFLPVSCFTPRAYIEHAYHILIAKFQFHRKGFPDSTIQCSHPVPHFHITFL